MNKNEIGFWELLAAKLHGELSHEEKSLFEDRMDDKQNQNLFTNAQKIHEGLNEVKRLKNSDKNSSWNSVEKGLLNKTIGIYTRQFLKYAAILIVAFGAGIYFHNTISKDSDQKVQYAEIEVMYGQLGHLFLFDGTEVWLNSGTKFKYPNKFNQNERNVYIEGEAFFKVAPNKDLPFKVKTGDLEVEVLGTSFNVSAYHGESTQSVVLVEGKVQINSREGKIIGKMVPGQIAVKVEGDSILQLKNADSYFYTSWKDGKVIFTGEKLEDIAKKIERWYNVKIRFENESLKDFKFSGTILRNKPIDQTIMAMEQLAPIRFNYEVQTDKINIITIVEKRK